MSKVRGFGGRITLPDGATVPIKSWNPVPPTRNEKYWTYYRRARPFLRAIVEEPDDTMNRLVFADQLDEWGLAREAAGQRWAAKWGLRPVRSPHYIKEWSINTPRYGLIGGWAVTDLPSRELPVTALGLQSNLYGKSTLPVAFNRFRDRLVVRADGRSQRGLLRAEFYFLHACGELFWISSWDGLDFAPNDPLARRTPPYRGGRFVLLSGGHSEGGQYYEFNELYQTVIESPHPLDIIFRNKFQRLAD